MFAADDAGDARAVYETFVALMMQTRDDVSGGRSVFIEIVGQLY